jgi:hypothetical protein
MRALVRLGIGQYMVRLRSAHSPRGYPFLNDFASHVLRAAILPATGCRFKVDPLSLQFGGWPVEELGQVVVFALHATEMYRERQNCAFIAPARIDDSLAPRGLKAYVFSRHSGYPGFALFFNISTVVTYKLQHKELEG